jgi:thioredoxin 1
MPSGTMRLRNWLGSLADLNDKHRTARPNETRRKRSGVGRMGAVSDVTDATFEEMVLKSDKPVVVDYWADWCGPCKQVEPIIEELARSHGDRVSFVKMDTNTNPVTPANNYVLGLPTIQVYYRGELVKAFKGAKSKSVLLGAIEEYL